MRARFARHLLVASLSRRGIASMGGTSMIEVERKFAPPDLVQLARRVEELGGKRVSEASFTDVYFDTPDCALTRRDIWLRRRDDEWELKLPVEAKPLPPSPLPPPLPLPLSSLLQPPLFPPSPRPRRVPGRRPRRRRRRRRTPSARAASAQSSERWRAPRPLTRRRMEPRLAEL